MKHTSLSCTDTTPIGCLSLIQELIEDSKDQFPITAPTPPVPSTELGQGTLSVWWDGWKHYTLTATRPSNPDDRSRSIPDEPTIYLTLQEISRKHCAVFLASISAGRANEIVRGDVSAVAFHATKNSPTPNKGYFIIFNVEADPEHPINSMVFQVTNYTALPDSQYGIVCFRQKPNATFLKSPTDNSQDRIAFSGDPAL